MKHLALALLLCSTSPVFAATAARTDECDNIAGTFRGMCTETDRETGKQSQYDMGYEIQQSKCEKVDIDMITYPDEWMVQHHFDLTKGLILMEDSGDIKIYSGGTFTAPGFGFGGTVIFAQDGDIYTIFTSYRKTGIQGVSHLQIEQSTVDSHMSCDLTETK